MSDTARILNFLDEIGIATMAATVSGEALLRGMDVVRGVLHYDPEGGFEPGDLLHEAGHIAVTPPDEHGNRPCIPRDGGEEMAAIAWSYAAARFIGIDAHVLFHDKGYKGDAAWMAETFAAAPPFGVPLLACWGMTSMAAYPAMDRWLR